MWKLEREAEQNAVSLCTDRVREWLLHPERALLPETEWPARAPRARVHGEPQEVLACLVEMYERGILAEVPEEEVLTIRGAKILNGLFAVVKKGEHKHGAKQVCRVILNMVPSNTYLRALGDSLPTLAASTSWT
eukprot:2328436-Amphidinium_carterae.1